MKVHPVFEVLPCIHLPYQTRKSDFMCSPNPIDFFLAFPGSDSRLKFQTKNKRTLLRVSAETAKLVVKFQASNCKIL